MSDQGAGEMSVTSESDIVSVRRRIREVAHEMGFGITDITRIVTAGSELTRNMYLYAASGVVRWSRLKDAGRTGIELVFEDRGPGIADVDQVMQEGYSSARGLGMGLPGSRRLMDEMEIDSDPGTGTTITIRKWTRS